MYTYLHNNRCSKSREWLKLMEMMWKKYVLREYLTNSLNIEELNDLQEKLWMRAIEFTRTWEKEFKQAWLTEESTDSEILKAMSVYPKLMERPIVSTEKWATIWRPIENISNFINKH